MKTLLRIGLLCTALSLVGLLAGCVTQKSARRSVLEYQVVETSIKRAMTPLEEAELRVAVLRYLESHKGLAAEPSVKFYLPTDEEDAVPVWVVVRFSENSGGRYEPVAAYPRYYWQTGPYYSYDYYPWGYDNFGRFSVQYYDDWIYTNGRYIPRDRSHDGRGHDGRGRDGRGHDGRGRDDRRHGDKDRDGDRDHRPPPVAHDSNNNHPRPPPVERTRWNRPTGGDIGGGNRPHRPDRNGDRNRPDNPWQGRASQNETQRTPTSSESYRPVSPPAPVSTRSEPVYSPPPSRDNSSHSNDSGGGDKRHGDMR